MLFSVVIPMYNEEKNVKNTLSSLLSYLEGLNLDFEIVVYDDGSRDTSARIVSEFFGNDPRVRLICNPVNRGKGAAVKDGVLEANGDFILFTDCDLAYGCESVGRMLAEISKKESDLVIGSRAIGEGGYESYSGLRKFVSKAYVKYLKVVSGFDLSDSQCGIKSFSAVAAKDIFSRCETRGFAFDLEVLTVAKKLGYKISEMPVAVKNHSDKGSKVRVVRDSFKMISEVRKINKRHKDLTPNGGNSGNPGKEN